MDLNETVEIAKRKPVAKSTRSLRVSSNQSPDIDAGWAWVIAGAAVGASAISSGVYFTFSMYFPLLLNEFHASRAITAWVGSLNNGIYMLAGPIAAYFIKRIGCRYTIMLGGFTSMIGLALSSLAPTLPVLFVTYGVIAAFGLCLNYTSWIVAISDSFHTKHAMAFSLSQSGVGVGIFLFGPLFSHVIGTYGWRGAFLITGACTFQLTWLGSLIFPPRKPIKQHEDGSFLLAQKKESQNECESDVASTATRLGVDHRVWILHLSSFLWLLATSIPYILLADYTSSLHLEEYYIIMLTSMGIGDLIGRLALGPLITICKWNVTKMYAASQFLCAIAILSFIFVFNGVQMIIQGVVFSVTFGLQCVLYALVPRSTFGSEHLNRFFGVTMFFGGIGILIGPPIAGQLVDSTTGRSYFLAFVFASVVQFMSSIATLVCLLISDRSR